MSALETDGYRLSSNHDNRVIEGLSDFLEKPIDDSVSIEWNEFVELPEKRSLL